MTRLAHFDSLGKKVSFSDVVKKIGSVNGLIKQLCERLSKIDFE